MQTLEGSPFAFYDFATRPEAPSFEEIMKPLAKPRVLVFGSRDWYSYDLIRRDMWYLRKVIGDYTLVQGEAKGADTYARLFANTQGWEVDPFPADWVKHGKAAGPIRNQRMLDSGIDYAMGYVVNYSAGSMDMYRRLQSRSVPTRIARMNIVTDLDFPEI